jgi:hypothetical protein
MFWFISLLACGDSATFEEPVAAPPVEAALEVPPKDDLPVVVPEDGRPDVVEVKAEANAPGAPPPAGQPWPPIVVPQDAREREWEWDFKASSGTKKVNPSDEESYELDDESRKKMEELEMKSIQ